MKFEKKIMELLLYALLPLKYYGCPLAFPFCQKTHVCEGFLCENLFNFIRSIKTSSLYTYHTLQQIGGVLEQPIKLKVVRYCCFSYYFQKRNTDKFPTSKSVHFMICKTCLCKVG